MPPSFRTVVTFTAGFSLQNDVFCGQCPRVSFCLPAVRVVAWCLALDQCRRSVLGSSQKLFRGQGLHRLYSGPFMCLFLNVPICIGRAIFLSEPWSCMLTGRNSPPGIASWESHLRNHPGVVPALFHGNFSIILRVHDKQPSDKTSPPRRLYFGDIS